MEEAAQERSASANAPSVAVVVVLLLVALAAGVVVGRASAPRAPDATLR